MPIATVSGVLITNSSSDRKSSPTFDGLWKAALRRYEKETGKDLLKHRTVQTFPSNVTSVDEVMQLIEAQNASFQAFRASGRKVRDALKPVVNSLLLMKSCVDSASASTSIHPCFSIGVSI